MDSNNIEIKDPKLFSASSVLDVFSTYNDAKGFNIPIYQRLYAWGESEIKNLLDDFYNSFKLNNSKDYFIGNLTLNFNEISYYYDIIDGQQRMTTLWLIGLVLQMKLKNFKNTQEQDYNNYWNNFLFNEDNVLLFFTSRDEDNLYLKHLIKTQNIVDITKGVGKKNNAKMVEAIRYINKYLEIKAEDDSEFNLYNYSKYIYEKVKLAAIFLPKTIDLNKYFEDMNNRGLQLEAHHIIKAKLLEKINPSLQNSYAKVWDAISQMNQYVEYGFANEDETLKKHRKNLIDSNYSSINNNYFTKQDKEKDEKSLKNIIDNANVITEDNKEKKVIVDNVTSILNFPEFLLICLGLYSGKNIPFDDKKLTDIFIREIREEKFNAKQFIEHLFLYRVLFDKYIIKSVTTNEVTKWEIRKIKEDSNNQYVRYEHLQGDVVQIQSMLNVSTGVNLWLPKVLELVCNLVDEKIEEEPNIDSFVKQIEKVDDGIDTHKWSSSINLNKGTSTNRYWFFKLDYLLWKKWSEDDSNYPKLDGVNKSKIYSFQFRDNRSVEHIHPQNPDYETWENIEHKSLSKIKNQFGNLALISIRSNSSYNNQPTSDKRMDFIKRTKHWGIESLKLLAAYSYQDWTIENMEMHQTSMISILENHYKTQDNEN